MPTYNEVGIVLRTHKLGEHDRIITLLTRGRGKLRAVAKGVRRTKSKFGSRLEPGMIVNLQCYEGRNLDTVTQADLVAPYGEQVTHDYGTYTAAAAMLETAERICEDHEVQLQQFNLLAGGLAALAGRKHDTGLILDSYLLRAVAIAGWAPSFDRCATCGDPGPHRAFNLSAGGAVCRLCRRPGSTAPRPETFTLLGALLAADWDTADASSDAERTEATGLVAAYVQWHIERGVRSLRLVDRTRPDLPAPSRPEGAHP